MERMAGLVEFAWWWSSGMAFLFVGSLYMLPASLRGMPRNASAHIKGRIGSLTVACLICCGLTVWLLPEGGGTIVGPALTSLGVRFDISLVTAVFVPLIVASTLFIGPLFERAVLFIKHPRPRQNPPWSSVALRNLVLGSHADEDTLVVLRALVFAPIFEEIVFRACMLPLLCRSGSTCTTVVLGSPLLFGIAHLHHAVQSLRDGVAPVQVAAVVTLQTFYTSLFGIFANFVFLRTGHLAAVVVLHAFCNNMGFPAPECGEKWSRAYDYRHGASLQLCVPPLLHSSPLLSSQRTCPDRAPSAICSAQLSPPCILLELGLSRSSCGRMFFLLTPIMGRPCGSNAESFKIQIEEKMAKVLLFSLS